MSERQPEERDPIRQILKAGALYFVIVFGADFVLGTMRTIWTLPSFGTRRAELMEAPIMFAITVLASRWVVRRFATRASFPGRLTVG
jgi:nicotinamide riboside transporter PnuC